MNIEVSVVIATYKRTALLERCLKALIEQSVSSPRYEVIVVTDGPDETAGGIVYALKNSYKTLPAFHCISLEEKRGPAAARNAGWKAARGELILFTDDDCIPTPGWIENMLLSYEAHRHTRVAFCGKIKVPLPSRPTDHEKNTALLEQAEFVTANCGCSKKALEMIGGLDEDFTMAWREDSALEFDLLENNIPIISVFGAIVVHPVRNAPWGISLREQKKTMFNPLLYKKHPVLYQQKIHKYPPFIYYGIIFFALTTLVTALLQLSSVMVGSFTGCVALIGWFTHKRLKGASLALKHVAEMVVTSVFIPFLSVYWTLYGAVRYKIFFVWNNRKPPVLKSQSYEHCN